MTALALKFYGIEFRLYEEDKEFSSDTKAGTILTRTIEAFRRYGVDEAVLSEALRLDEIGEINRATNAKKASVLTEALIDETRFPFVLNIPQHHLEPLLATGLEDMPAGTVNLRHRLKSFEQNETGVIAHLDGPDGPVSVEGSYLIEAPGSTLAPHWRGLARAVPIPENEIKANPQALIDETMAGWTATKDLKSFDARAAAHYRAFVGDSSRIAAMCADYRAGATVDRAAAMAEPHAVVAGQVRRGLGRGDDVVGRQGVFGVRQRDLDDLRPGVLQPVDAVLPELLDLGRHAVDAILLRHPDAQTLDRL
eukprot:gene35021-47054_t